MFRSGARLIPFLLLGLLSTSTAADVEAKSKKSPSSKAQKALEFTDLMKMRTIEGAEISDDGRFVVYVAKPDRGDGEVGVRSTDGKTSWAIERGTGPEISADGRYVAALVEPPMAEKEAGKKEGKKGDGPKNGLALLSTTDGETSSYENVSAFAFTEDGAWLAIHHGKAPEPEAEEGDAGEAAEGGQEAAAEEPAEEEPAEEEETAETAGAEEASSEEAVVEDEKEEKKDERLGTVLRLRRLADGFELEIPHVESYALAETAGHVAYAVAAPGGENGLFVHELPAEGEGSVTAVTEAENGRYTASSWAEDTADLAFVAAVDDEDGEPGDGAVWIYQGSSGEGRAVATGAAVPEGWQIASKNELTWSRDGQRLFYGTRPRPEKKEEKGDDDAPFDPYDTEAILDSAGVDVWHVDDPLIKPNEKKQWNEEKDRTYLAVYDRQRGRSVQLADRTVRNVVPGDAERAVVAMSDVPYLRERTWDGFYADLYWVSLEDGEKRRVAERLGEPGGELSPNGRYLTFYSDPHWYLYDADTGTTRNLTEGMAVSFSNELDDYPASDPSYGSEGWLADGSAVLINDRFDLWRFPADGSEPTRLTEGRADSRIFRLVDLDSDEPHVDPSASWLLEGYHDLEKHDSLFRLAPGGSPEKLLEEPKRFDVMQKAENSDEILYTRESYTEFPDLWVTDAAFGERRKLTDVNPQISEFAWGEASLVDFRSDDGWPLQAVLIRPNDLQEGETCPVLIYYYRYFSQRLHQFNEPKVNHRPSFPVYASHGYCIFLPDVRFEIGRPGLAAMKSVVPGVRKLIEMGIADPDALGLHGHSWSGYQTAHIVTQTDLFTAAVAGAPVSNMTSAYGGIRYTTGLARQFQYEKSQSRLGASLWEGRDRYIENSPLFYADQVETPLLLMFGDVDGAVPWTQGIELYLALRRLGKEAVFLQYRDEGHHPKQYGNKLDYSIKMKEFFDHYLKGAPAPAWWTEGVPYRGD